MSVRAAWILTTVGLVAAAGAVQADGNVERGKGLYAVCATCHGERGEGVEEMNGPALVGLEPWYLVRQLENFKAGIRGSDPKDIYGLQMAPMAKILPDTQAMEDIAAYLQSLGGP
jgi:cytochrome c553